MSQRYLKVWVPEWLAPILAFIFDQFGQKWHEQIGLFKANPGWREKMAKDIETGRKSKTTRAFREEVARLARLRESNGRLDQ